MHASLSTISAKGTTAWPRTSNPPADASPALLAPFVAAEHDALIFFHPFSGTTNNLRTALAHAHEGRIQRGDELLRADDGLQDVPLRVVVLAVPQREDGRRLARQVVRRALAQPHDPIFQQDAVAPADLPTTTFTNVAPAHAVLCGIKGLVVLGIKRGGRPLPPDLLALVDGLAGALLSS